MVARRALLIFAFVLLTAGFLSALSAPRPEEEAVKPPYRAVVAPPPEARGELPRDEVVRASVGDAVVLTLRAEQPDVAELSKLGLEVDVGPDMPATLEFVADQAGEFPVTLVTARRELGRLVVDAGR